MAIGERYSRYKNLWNLKYSLQMPKTEYFFVNKKHTKNLKKTFVLFKRLFQIAASNQI